MKVPSATGTGKRRQRRRSAKRREGTVAIVDRFLLRPFAITMNGRPQQVATVEAIILQLLEKGISGNNRAWQVLLKYQEFARRRTRKELELKFVDNEYTRALATSTPEQRDE
jgi:hypothetical protein